jgi:DNA (cytosine-5)-methyltransferase 1
MGLKAISIYSGVGGLDFGFEAAGFDTFVALDLDPVACRTMRLNRPWPVIEGDIAGVSSRVILDTAGLARGEADVLIGGPPCQPFSKSGYWVSGDAKRLDDPRADTLKQYLRVLGGTLPRTFLLENVPGLRYRGKSEGIEVIREAVAEINAAEGTRYSISVETLSAAKYGVPQLRERVFVVGSRDGREFRFPNATHTLPGEATQRSGLLPFRTAWDALGDLPENPNDEELRMTGKWAELLPTIPEGENYLWHTDRGGGRPLFGWRRRYWSFMLKLSKRLPSWTIQAQPGPATGPFHWRNRKLSAVELGRLQTFPDGIHYECRRADAQRLIGNAVPSALAEVLAGEMAHQFLRIEANGALPSLLPPRRDRVPEPEPLAPIPSSYAKFIGEHDEHPGTGRGRRAKERKFATASSPDGA